MKKIGLAVCCFICMMTAVSFAKVVELDSPDPFEYHPVQVETTNNASYYRYANERYGFSIDVPVEFSVASEADNGDGCDFADPKSGANFIVYSTSNIMNLSLMELYNVDVVNAGSPAELQKSFGKDWYVMTWTKGNKSFYKKVITGGSEYFGLAVSYPTAQESHYAEIIAHMDQSLVTGWQKKK
jgi:hypothetical protein